MSVGSIGIYGHCQLSRMTTSITCQHWFDKLLVEPLSDLSNGVQILKSSLSDYKNASLLKDIDCGREMTLSPEIFLVHDLC